MTLTRIASTLLYIAATLTCEGVALAQSANDPRLAAREHFDRGVAAFDQRRFGDAAKEFRAAYDLSPSYMVLYNIGQVSAALGQSVEAVDAFQAYLEQGGSTIAEERRAAVLAEIDKQRVMIGTLLVRAKPDGAKLHVDGKVVGTAPLPEPIRLTAGQHSLVVMLDGYEAQSREIRVNAGAQSDVELALASAHSVTVAPAPAPVVVVPGPGTQTSTPASTIVNVQVPQQAAAPAASTSGHQRTAGYVLGGLGVAVIGVGAYLNVTALTDANDAKSRGDGEAFSSAKTRNYWGWGTIAAGGVAATTGAVLILTGPSGSATGGLRVSPFSNGCVVTQRSGDSVAW
jgi:hypothetical protein